MSEDNILMQAADNAMAKQRAQSTMYLSLKTQESSAKGCLPNAGPEGIKSKNPRETHGINGTPKSNHGGRAEDVHNTNTE